MRGRFNHLTRKIKDRLLGYQRVDAYRLNRESCERYAAQLLRFGPIGLIGYTSALDLFAQYTPQFRERFHQSNLRFVLATAEPPTRADSLEMMSDLFGCPVVQEYGGAEFGQIAFKVGDEPFRVYADLNYLECEKPRDQQSEKSLLVTSLYPRYLPLIRYRVGDSVAGEKTMDHGHVCQFNSIAGRINDVIRLDDGDSIHSVAIFHCIHQEATIRNIQMVVSDLGIEIRLASTCTSDSQISDRIRTRLGEVHPSLLRANIVFVEDLETNRAGKRRWFIDERKEERNQ
jgi:phenylacetate-coenzyme A ligase PaaK-like adenylate-forming protein